MVLSIAKLEKLLASKGYLPRTYFSIHGLCAYIEVMSIKNADIFMLSIPSKYKFNVEKGDANIFKIRPIDMGDDDRKNTTDEYAGSPDNLDLEKTYTEIEMVMSPDNYDDEDGNVASRLEEAYKRPISLKDISKEDTKNVRDIFRQLKRLKFCVQNIRYKLVIFWNVYLCVLNRDDSIECFYIKKYPTQSNRKLLVASDLELFYERLDSNIERDLSQVRQGIYKVLDKNQEMHTRNINRMLEERNDVIKFSNVVQAKKAEYQRHISNFETLLFQVIESEKSNLEKLYSLSERTDPSFDTTIAHQKGKIERELSLITQAKQDIIKNIFTLKNSLEDMILTTDKIMFDNSVMFDQILRNFGKLEEIVK